MAKLLGLNFGRDFEILKLKISCSFESEVLVEIWKLTYGRDSEAVFSATLVKVLNPWVCCTFGNVCVCVCGVCVCVCVCVCMYVCTYVCTYVCMYNGGTYC